MVKRLLFVDDEAVELEGLRRSLHGMWGEWEMRFEKSAADALQAMADSRFDAIITDLRMPSMDGAGLLEVVKRRYPGMVRFVLSGQVSKDVVLRSVVPAHQFLSKPWDPVELKHRLTLNGCKRSLQREFQIATATTVPMRSLACLTASPMRS
jgi:DNA-binding NtrC family response regulator